MKRERTGMIDALLNSKPTTLIEGRIVGYRKPPWWKFWAKPKPIREFTLQWTPRQ